MNRGIQRGLGLATMRGVDSNLLLPRPHMPFASGLSGITRWVASSTSNATSQTLVQDSMYGKLFYFEPGHTVVGIGVTFGATASTTGRIGIYVVEQGLPGTLLYDTQEELDGASTAFKFSSMSVVEEGWVVLAIAFHGAASPKVFSDLGNDAGDQTGITDPANNLSGGFSRTGVTGALPNPWGPTVTDLSRAPRFQVDMRMF